MTKTLDEPSIPAAPPVQVQPIKHPCFSVPGEAEMQQCPHEAIVNKNCIISDETLGPPLPKRRKVNISRFK